MDAEDVLSDEWVLLCVVVLQLSSLRKVEESFALSLLIVFS